MLVQNEDRFIWFAIRSVLPYVDQLLILKTIKSSKIVLTQLTPTDRAGLIARRRQQLQLTKTDWMLVIDGDEIWPKQSIKSLLQHIKQLPKSKVAVVNRTRNSVGDVYHYQPESAGKYSLLGRTGHLTIRAMRVKGLTVSGNYPLEAFNHQGQPINQQDHKLSFLDVWYLHTTHLPRTTNSQAAQQVIDRVAKHKLEIGRQMSKDELPEVFFRPFPDIVPNPFTIALTPQQKLIASLVTPLKRLKRASGI
jgi:hypothetical protein